MATEKLYYSGGMSGFDTNIGTQPTEASLSGIIGGGVVPTGGGGEGYLVCDDVKLSVTRTGAGKQIWINSDGTLGGTVVKTAAGVIATVTCDSVLVNLNNLPH